MNVLAIDYGLSKIGLALGESSEKIGAIYGIINNKNKNAGIDQIAEICKQENIELIILGYEERWHSTLTPYSKHYQQFIIQLEKSTNLKIVKVDESLTTQMAKRQKIYNLKGEEDATAALIILNTYFESLS